MTEIRRIELPGRYQLDIQMTPVFIERVRQHYGLPFGSELSNDHLQRYVIEAMKVALDGAQQ